jgi:hypothetical protein
MVTPHGHRAHSVLFQSLFRSLQPLFRSLQPLCHYSRYTSNEPVLNLSSTLFNLLHSSQPLSHSHALAIRYTSNEPVLNLFTGKPLSLVILLDEEARIRASSSKTLVAKIAANLEGTHVERIKTNSTGFTVVHYAGSVEYVSLLSLLISSLEERMH